MSKTIKNLLTQAKTCYKIFLEMNRSTSWKLQKCGTEEEMREVAAKICRNYLHGSWKRIDASDLEFRRISGGLSNFLYFVGLPDKRELRRMSETETYTKEEAFFDEPRKVLIRIYGQIHGERAMDAIVTESVIFTLLSERRLGPKLHGVFPGGRIEEYVPARSLKTCELAEPALSMKIAEKTAAIHTMDLPLNKEPAWLWKTMAKWLKTVKEERLAPSKKGQNLEEEAIIRRLREIDFDKEIEWVKRFVAGVDSPVHFCHNDLQEGNILLYTTDDDTADDDVTYPYPALQPPTPTLPPSPTLRSVPSDDQICVDEDSVCSRLSDSGEPQIVLIDFEYCAYNYRGFDIANHFQEWVYDYTNPEHPFYYENTENAPTLEQKEIFIKEYLKHYLTTKSDGKEYVQPSIDEINNLLNEVEAFALASHLFWALWSIVNAATSEIPFGYWEYAVSRFDTYLRLKQEVMKKEQLGIPQKRKICEVDI